MGEIFNKKSTPNRICGVLLEAMEIIQQLRRAAVPPPNDPLTLEELREMDGEPVWLVGADDAKIERNGYAAVDFRYFGSENVPVIFWFGTETENEPDPENYGKTWRAYRRRPEEGN